MRTPTLAFLVAVAGCAGSTPATDDGQPPPSADGSPGSESPPAHTPPPKPTKFGPLAMDQLPTTDDGIPILTVAKASAAKTGAVTWIPKDALALATLPRAEASDGETSYLVVDDDSSILVRGTEVHEGIMRRFGVEKGGCGAMRRGEIVLSGVITTDRDEPVVSIQADGSRRNETRKQQAQILVRIAPDGRESVVEVPREFGTEQDCKAWLGRKGDVMLALSRFVHHDGKTFQAIDGPGLGWYHGRTVVGSPKGRRFCFWSCNGTEEKQTDPLTGPLVEALGVRHTGNAEWIAYDGWIAGATANRAVRAGEDDAIAKVDGIPGSDMLNGSLDIAFTGAGDLVIGTKYRFREYVVWRAGAKTLSPVRTLDRTEVIANASPTILVRGLGGGIPDSSTYAVLLGKPIDVGTGGGTYGHHRLESSKAAHVARFARAKAVLGKGGRLVGAHEAVVDLTCGAYVRSPLGWEEVQMHDWVPPVLPKLHAKAVTRPAKCVPLAEVSAVPGLPDLLLGRSGDQLVAAWLPPPLPLPTGRSMLREEWVPPRGAKAEIQRPRPGTGWFTIGHADDVEGDDGIADPGGDTAIADGSWQAGGAAVVTVDGTRVLVTPNGAVTLPKNTKPMAVGTAGKLHVWGAIGSKLVDCTTQCRVLDPGVDAEIVSVVPRSETALVLGYADGRLGVYGVPASGGESIPQHELVKAIDGALAKAPVDTGR